MSHEIRTPMNAILGFSELLAKTPMPEATIKRYSEIIHSRSDYLLSLIDDILDLSQVEAGILSLKIAPFQLNELFDDLADQLRMKISNQKKNIDIIIQKERKDGDSLICTDKNRLLQLLLNLSDNAVKFTMEGSITISYRMDEDKGILFTVSDTGIGIGHQNKEQIFERFHKSNNISLNYSGLGLGLSICKGIIKILGGKIWVDSELNRGSSFNFSIPVNFKQPVTSYQIPGNQLN
jgi:signal transduction histidine kinase